MVKIKCHKKTDNPSIKENAADNFNEKIIERAAEDIPKPTKNVIIMWDFNGIPIEKMSVKLGYPVNVIKKVIEEHEKISTKKVPQPLTFDTPLEKNFEGLLPCPYCGGNAKIRCQKMPENHPKYDMAYYIQCDRCHIQTDEVKTGFYDWWGGKTDYNVSSTEAITLITKIWNERTLTEEGKND